MKNPLVIIALLLSAVVYGQTNETLSELEKFKVTPEVLTMTFNEDWPNVSFDRNSVSTTVGDDFKITEVAKYDASKPQGQKWTLVSVNDKAPKDDYIKPFNAEKNGKKTPLTIDTATLKKESDDAAGVVFSFKYIKKSIPDNYAYLKDCTTKATINKSSGKLEKLEITNDGPTKLGMLKISVMKFTFTYTFDEALGGYIIPRYEQTSTGKFLGATATNNEVREFSNFKKVN